MENLIYFIIPFIFFVLYKVLKSVLKWALQLIALLLIIALILWGINIFQNANTKDSSTIKEDTEILKKNL